MDAALPGHDDLADVLEKLLRNPLEDHRIRMLAARALGQIGCKRSTQALLHSLEDEFPSVRHEAIIALGKIGDISARAYLTKLLESESTYVRGACARALIQILGVPAPEKENIEMLTKLLSSGDILVKEALLEIGKPALDFLAAGLDDDSFSLRSQAALVLALHMRRLFDQLPPGEFPFDWLKDQDLSAKTIGDLYSFRITRLGGSVAKVENSGFDSVSRTLCGMQMLQLSIAPFVPCTNMRYAKTKIVALESLLSLYDAGNPIRMGRTLVAPAVKGYLAIKICVEDGDVARLLHEARMQEHLQGLRLSSRIPQPLGGLFKIKGLPRRIEEELGLSSEHAYAICYIAGDDYFQYLSDPGLSEEEMRRGMASCAEDLGRLAGTGLIHTSLIPLFHNRERRTGGDCTYRWNKKLAGRLDNWLESCRYPNLRLSGIADLEHLELHPEVSPQSLQVHAGEHLFSMSLVLGCSLCRRKSLDYSTIGRAIKDCFQRYYRSMTGIEQESLDDCIDWDHLACRMVEEMGFDRSDECADAALDSSSGVRFGTHLGRHNGPFPLPELLRAVHIASTFMVLELQARLKAGFRAGPKAGSQAKA